MSRLELPDGQWAELASPRKVSELKRRRYIAAMTNLTSGTADLPQIPGDFDPKTGKQAPSSPDPKYFNGSHMALSDALGDALILCLVREWSFGEVSAAALEELPVDTFEPLFKACRDLAPELTPDYGADDDPKALGGGSTRSPTPSLTADTSTFAMTSSDGTS